MASLRYPVRYCKPLLGLLVVAGVVSRLGDRAMGRDCLDIV
jgi:hypothetical protein